MRSTSRIHVKPSRVPNIRSLTAFRVLNRPLLPKLLDTESCSGQPRPYNPPGCISVAVCVHPADRITGACYVKSPVLFCLPPIRHDQITWFIHIIFTLSQKSKDVVNGVCHLKSFSTARHRAPSLAHRIQVEYKDAALLNLCVPPR